MNKSSIAAIAAVAIVLAFVFFRPSTDQQAPQPDRREIDGATGTRDSGSGGADRTRGGGSGGAAGDRGNAVRDRLAAAAARAAAHGSDEGKRIGDSGIDDSDPDVVEQRVALRAKKPAKAPGNDAGDDTTTADAEPAPNVAYESGIDSTFSTANQTELHDMGELSGLTGTVSFWVKPGWQEGNQDAATFVQIGENGLQFVKNADALRFEYPGRNGQREGFETGIGRLNDGEWHQVVGTWIGASYQVFIDGSQIALNTSLQGPYFRGTAKVYVGSNVPSGSAAAPGDVTGVRVSDLPSSPAEVINQYQYGPRPE
jgi:hypothetical protein